MSHFLCYRLAKLIITQITMTDSHTYYETRLATVAGGGAESCYPTFTPSVTAPVFRNTWGHLEADETDGIIVQMTGRVENKRIASKSLIFLDIQQGGQDLPENLHFQILLSKKIYNADRDEEFPLGLEFKQISKTVNRGDIVGVVGRPHRTKRGELSVQAIEIHLLVPCLHEIPHALEDQALIDRHRYLHYIVNRSARLPTLARAKALFHIRAFLNDLDFMELETPMLEHGTGANATPFTTKYNAIDREVNLRVAPELYLKTAVASGFGRVYEIGRQFRNEGVDRTHNPEFTSCEFYMPYASRDDLMKITEDMLCGLYEKIKMYRAEADASKDNFWRGPYQRIDIMTGLERELECQLPPPYDTESFRQMLIELTQEKGIDLPSVHTTPKLLDNLISVLLEPTCQRPTFLTGHPLVMCPLAKPDPDHPHLSQRFELFVTDASGQPLELVNAYPELNNPVLQRQNFLSQTANKEQGDTETINDDGFCTVLEYGMPPTSGWGMGVDRLLMLMLGIKRMGDVMTFQLTRSSAPKAESKPTEVSAHA